MPTHDLDPLWDAINNLRDSIKDTDISTAKSSTSQDFRLTAIEKILEEAKLAEKEAAKAARNGIWAIVVAIVSLLCNIALIFIKH